MKWDLDFWFFFVLDCMYLFIYVIKCYIVFGNLINCWMVIIWLGLLVYDIFYVNIV